MVSQIDVYQVKPKTPVTLSVTIGDAQVGGTAVLLNGKLVGNGKSITDLAVGAKDQDLRGSNISCTTTVQDVNPATNHTSVTYALRGGVNDRDFTYEVSVSEAGGQAIYIVIFMLS
jgi:hypothetical protein